MRVTKDNILYLIKKVWQLNKGLFPLVIIFICLSTIKPFINIFFPRFLVDELTQNQDINKIILIITVFAVMSLTIYPLIEYLSNINVAKQTKVRMDLLFEVQHKIFTIPFKYLENPEVLNKKESTIQALIGFDTGIQYILNQLLVLINSSIAFIGYIVIISSLSWYVLLYLFISVCIVYHYGSKLSKYETEKELLIWGNDRKSNYFKSLMNDFSYGKDIRLYNLKDWILYKVKAVMNKSINMTKDVRKKHIKYSILELGLAMGREGIVYSYLVYLVLNGDIEIGQFLMYFITIAGFASLLNQIISSVVGIKAQSVHVQNVKDFLELPDDDLQGEDLDIKPPYQITFEHVSFKYPDTDEYILKDISITIKAGEKLAIVGENGAGKTTFIKLLTRLYEPTQGTIYINGINAKNISKREYYTLFSVVFQDYKILAFSAKENVTLQNDTTEEERFVNSIKQAQIYDKLMTLPLKESTAMLKNIDDHGVELSQGEKQKLALARALYKNGGIVLLDEPTASLSPLAEKEIYTHFNKMVKNKTAVFISHRLASTQFCDNIAFFKNGQITEYGTHEELISQNNDYSHMYLIQAQYYKEEGGTK